MLHKVVEVVPIVLEVEVGELIEEVVGLLILRVDKASFVVYVGDLRQRLLRQLLEVSLIFDTNILQFILS